ncbi:hypothetical protein GCM10028821_47240 [Hymenobacter jeollabukensis]
MSLAALGVAAHSLLVALLHLLAWVLQHAAELGAFALLCKVLHALFSMLAAFIRLWLAGVRLRRRYRLW